MKLYLYAVGVAELLGDELHSYVMEIQAPSEEAALCVVLNKKNFNIRAFVGKTLEEIIDIAKNSDISLSVLKLTNQ